MGIEGDREAILRRRALLVASALATLAGTEEAQAAELAVAGSDELGACEGRPDPSPEELALAQQRQRLVESHLAVGDRAAAQAELIRIYRSTHARPTILRIAELRDQDGDFNGAILALKHHLDCVDPRDAEVRVQLDRLLTESATLVVRLSPGAGRAGEVFRLDGRVVPRASLLAGLRVRAGGHTLVRETGFGSEQFPFSLAPSEVREISIGAVRGLDPIPQPCLSIAPGHPREPLRLHAGFLGPIVIATLGEEPAALAGGGLRVALAAEPVSKLWFEVDGFGALTGGETLLGAVGGTLEVRYHPHPLGGFGVGVQGGYLDVESQRATPLADGAFVGPLLVPMSMIAGPLALELRVPFWFADVDGAFGPAAFAPQLVICVGAPLIEEFD